MGLFLRISTAEAVVNYFKERIASGELRPGDRLPSERVLQDSLGISRFALREGMARLNALGIVTSAQGKASVVNSDVDPRSLSDVFVPLAAGDRDKYLEDLFASRQLLEVECAGLAARRRGAGQLETMGELVESLAATLGDGTAYARLDYTLHHAIVEAADNVFLEKIHALLHDQLQPVIRKSVDDRAHRRESMEWHRRIVEAIAAGDEAAARAHMTSHLGACRLAYGI